MPRLHWLGRQDGPLRVSLTWGSMNFLSGLGLQSETPKPVSVDAVGQPVMCSVYGKVF